jgi:hypothetical protein
MFTKMRVAAIGATLAAGISLAGMAPAVAAPASPAATSGTLACGWDPRPVNDTAYYNHCASRGKVLIRVERHFGNPGFDRCVPPGLTFLGSLAAIRYAWYIKPC